MEQMRETRIADVENTRQVDLLQRRLGSRAYRVVIGEEPAGQPLVMGDVVLVYTATNVNRSFADEPMLPIEEFS